MTAFSDQEAASALASQSGGNPLLLEQLATDFGRGKLADGSRRLTLAELIQARVSRLSNSTRAFPGRLPCRRLASRCRRSVLVRLLPNDPGGAAAVSSLVSENLVRRRARNGYHEIEIQHSQIGEAVLAERSPTGNGAKLIFGSPRRS